MPATLNAFEIVAKRVEDRLVICRQCDQFRSSLQQCKKCGCFLPAKAVMPAAQCPLGNWED